MPKLPRIQNINARSKEAELLDEKEFSLEEIDEIYENINKINRWLGGDLPTLSAIKKLVMGKDFVRVIDVGSGGGGMCRNVSALLTRMGVEHNVTGVDINEDSLLIARKRSVDYPNVEFKKVDIFSRQFREMDADIIISTLTFHHLTNQQINELVDNSLCREKVVLIVNDLHRSKLAFYLFRIVSYIFSLHFVNRYDGLISILRSFKRNDLQAFESQALKNNPSVTSRISWKWAFRWLWIINKT